MPRRFFYNLLVALPIVLAMSFGFSLWQTGGQFFHSWGNIKFGDLLTISQAWAQSDCENYPVKSLLGEGRIYYDACRESFMMSKDGGDWEEMGGGLWKAFVSPNQNDIYNTNSGAVYVKTDTIFGLGGIITGTETDQVIELDDVNRNLIYGAVSLASTVDEELNQAASLLKLELFDKSLTSPYSNLLSVRVDGKVIIGSVGFGRLVAPEICLPDDSKQENCVKSWTSEGSESPAESLKDVFWASTSGDNSDEIENLNNLGGKAGVGGYVSITNKLNVKGSVQINSNPNDVNFWVSFSAGKLASSDINGIWYDEKSALNLGDAYDTVSSTGTVYYASHAYYDDFSDDKTFILMALGARGDNVNEGSIAVVLIGKQTNTPIYEFINTSESQAVNILPVGTSGSLASDLTAVCAIGSPHGTISVIKNFKIIATDNKGKIWKYAAYYNNQLEYQEHQWTNDVPSSLVVWKSVECRSLDSDGSKWEAYAVGTRNSIYKLSSDTGGFILGPENDASSPAINDIWLANRVHNAPYKYSNDYPNAVWARYYAAGAGGKIYTWPSKTAADTYFGSNNKDQLIRQIPDINYTFNAVGGQIHYCANCDDNGRYVYFGGDGGVIYRAKMTQEGLTPELVQKNNSLGPPKTTINYNITGITGNAYHIFTSNKSSAAAGSVNFLRYSRIGSLLLDIDDRTMESAGWSAINEFQGKHIFGFSGLAATGIVFVDHIAEKLRSKFNIVAGSSESNAIYNELLQFERSKGTWEDKPTSWNMIMEGQTVDLYSTWHPQNLIGPTSTNSFIGGDKGAIFKNKNDLVSLGGIDESIQNKLQISGIAGYPAGNSYKVYAVARHTIEDKGYIFYYNGLEMTNISISNGYGYKFNDIWSNQAGNIIVAVGSSGKVRYCSNTGNGCDASGNWVEATLGTADLLKVSGMGKDSIYFILNKDGYIYRCNGAPSTCTSSSISNKLKTLWVNDRVNEAWAAGIDGKIYRNQNLTTNSWSEYHYSVSGVNNLSSLNYTGIAGIDKLIFFSTDNSKIVQCNISSTCSFLTISSATNIPVYALASTTWPSKTDPSKIFGLVWAVGKNGLAKVYEVGSSAQSGDLYVENNIWGGSAGTVNVNPDTGIITSLTPGISSCPVGEFMVGLKVGAVDILTGNYPLKGIICQKL